MSDLSQFQRIYNALGYSPGGSFHTSGIHQGKTVVYVQHVRSRADMEKLRDMGIVVLEPPEWCFNHELV